MGEKFLGSTDVVVNCAPFLLHLLFDIALIEILHDCPCQEAVVQVELVDELSLVNAMHFLTTV